MEEPNFEQFLDQSVQNRVLTRRLEVNKFCFALQKKGHALQTHTQIRNGFLVNAKERKKNKRF